MYADKGNFGTNTWNEMINPSEFIKYLNSVDINFFCGVPDSLLKSFCAILTDTKTKSEHIITANEGSAIGLAAGYHLATGKTALVYMQNSGQGNTVNPLLSLVDKKVYNIPILLLIGWRGEPGVKDEPQHISQGELTIPLLETMGIKYAVFDETWQQQVSIAVDYMRAKKEVYALIVRKNLFDDYKQQTLEKDLSNFNREQAISQVAASMDTEDVVISTTGMISRELFEFREHNCQSHEKDFLTVGSMGHASQIALGVALQQPYRRVWCFDGDGALLMHLGGMALIGNLKPTNYVHVVYNNSAHDSVGGQPTVAGDIDILQIAKAVGYQYVARVDNEQDLKAEIQKIKAMNVLTLLEIRVKKGARKDLGRPTTTPIENKNAFMRNLLDI